MATFSFLKYITRILPALSLFTLVTLLSSSFVFDLSRTDARTQDSQANVWQMLFCIYLWILHIVPILFTCRAFRAVGYVSEKIRQGATDGPLEKASTDVRQLPCFVIIIPTYKEDMETLRSTLMVLASHPLAQSTYHVYLAMEEREENAEAKAKYLISMYSHKFHNMSFTVHPFGLPNEACGKSSNESWAAQQVLRDYSSSAARLATIVTTMDADTHLPARYFLQILRYYRNESPEARHKTMYVPPLVFDRNLHQVPLPVRTADKIWAGAGISNMHPSSTVCIPTSVYSLSLSLIEQVGGWDTDSGAIGEDMHMYLKCFFALSGNLHVEVIYAAASQCNVCSSLTGFKGYVGCILARYQQAIRHMWGSLDTGYAIRQAAKMLMRQLSSASIVQYHDSTQQISTVIAAVSALGKQDASLSTFDSQPINIANTLMVFCRLFEAHFIPVQLAFVLAASSFCNTIYPSSLMSPVVRTTLDFCSLSRLVSYGIMCCYLYRYEQYHQLCVGLRREDMRRAGLLEELGEVGTFTPNVFLKDGILEATIFPFGAFLFGSIPALQATFTHLFTDQLVFRVSLKPQLAVERLRLDHKAGQYVSNAIKAVF